MPWNTGPTSRGIVARHGVESALEAENARLKKLLAETMLENEVAKEALRKKW
jgi:hypothetical protein